MSNSNWETLKIVLLSKLSNRIDVFIPNCSFILFGSRTLIKKTTQTELVSNRSMETLSMLMQQSDSERPLGYQIIGDNVDLMIKVRHQASDKPDKSIHWFQLNAVKDRVR